MSIRFLTAQEAAAELGVSRATLYAYVSRGLIRSEPSEHARKRLYRADDVKQMRDRKLPGGNREETLRDALSFGAPILSSAITLIADGRLYYRGRDTTDLAKKVSFEHCAAILWRQDENDVFREAPPSDPTPGDIPPGLPRTLVALALAGESDLQALSLHPNNVARAGSRIIRLIAAGFTGALPSDQPLHEQLAAAWMVDDGVAHIIRAALVLCADHELNASAFTVRCAASTGAPPYAAVSAGLAALQGPRHGGQTAKVTAMLDDLVRAEDPSEGVAARLRRGDNMAGFDHTLYPNGDPRAKLLMAMIEEAVGGQPEWAQIKGIAAATTELTQLLPNIDFALASMARVFRLPVLAPFTMFAVGRCAGWIAHAQEQYESRQLLRPRARYIGDAPTLSGLDRSTGL
jgi:citrate synthase